MKRPPPPALAHLEVALDELERQGLRRTRPRVPLERVVSFCSNDYLGLANLRAPAAPASTDAPPGAGASRLVSGETAAHVSLERAVASWLDVPAALTFTSGYAANLGVLGALARPEDRIISDALNHASIVDGCRLSRAEVVVVPHLDVAAVASALRRPVRSNSSAARTWVVTESYFSMDADTPDLGALRRLCDEAGAGLIVDETHAFGVLGPDGRGLCLAANIVPDVWVGAFGKAFGRQGAFVAGAEVLIDWLWNRARSFVFSTGLSPALASSTEWAFHHAAAHPALRSQCLANAAHLRAELSAFGPIGSGPIIPLLIGDSGTAVRVAAEASAHGLHIQAIRPPTVPANTARLRLTASAAQSDSDVASAAALLRRLLSAQRFT